MGGLSVDVPVGTVQRALAIAELSCSDTVSITISLEQLVSLTQTVSCLVGQQLDEAIGHEKMAFDEERGAGSGHWGGGDVCFSGILYGPRRRQSGPNGLSSRGRIYLFCMDIFLLQNYRRHL